MLAFLALGLLAGCGSTDDPAAAEVPTWNGDVLSLMEEHCTSCHIEGGVGPMPLDTYESFEAPTPSTGSPVHEVVWPYVEIDLMPPYGSMTECRETVNDHTFVMDEDEKDILFRWLEADRPLGEGPEVHYEPPPSKAATLGEPDLIARRAEPYAPQFDGDGSDYACFMIDPGITEEAWVDAITPHVDNDRVVHHMLLFRTEPTGSNNCYGEEMLSDLLAGWAPGQDGWFLPDGVGFKLQPGDWFALQIHYDNSNDNGQKDRSGMALHFTEQATEEAGVLWTGSFFAEPGEPSGGIGEWIVPAEEKAYEVHGSCTVSEAMGDISIFGAWPHMHLLGSHMDATVVRDGMHECLVDVDFSFDDQRGYPFTEPVTLSPGDRIDTTCVFDNSDLNPDNPYDPPRDVRMGEDTNDEMCLNFLLYWPKGDVKYCPF